jgi:hypothetical protein
LGFVSLAFAAVAGLAARPAVAQVPEVFDPDNCIPPISNTKYYRSPAGQQQLYEAHQRWNEMIFRKPAHRQFSGCKQPPPPPPPPPDPPPPPQWHDFDSMVDGEASIDGGTTWMPVTGTAACSVSVEYDHSEGNKDFFTTEMIQLDITGLPFGFIVRESPTLPSVGVTTIRPVPGGYMISSYFDIYTEMSPDGGTIWFPSLDESGEPLAARVVLSYPDYYDVQVNHDIEVAGASEPLPAGSIALVDYSFDGGAPCAPVGWTVAGPDEGPPAFGRLHSHVTDNDVCYENTTCSWLFTDPALPACAVANAWGPGGLVVPAGVDQYLYSPLIDVTGAPAMGTYLHYQTFPGQSFPGARIVQNWSVRSLVGGVLTPWQKTGDFYSQSLWSWVTRTVDLSPYVDPAATDIQVRYRVADWGPTGIGCATVMGTDCGPGPGPYLDRIQIGRSILLGPVISQGIDSRSQAQDCFPAELVAFPVEHYTPTLDRFGPSPFSAGADATTCGSSPVLLTTDAIHVRVVDAAGAGGIVVSWYGAIIDGPHAGKAPPGHVVGANGFFEVIPTVVGDEYFVDLDDAYFRGGDVLVYFWAATDASGGFTSEPIGISGIAAVTSVAAAQSATGGLLEVSFLPTIDWDPDYLAAVAGDPEGDVEPTPGQIANSSQQNCILYVQAVNSRRRDGDSHRTSFMYTLDALGYRDSYDIYDVQGFGDTNNQLAGRATVAQAIGYALIVHDSGRRRTAQLSDGVELDSEKIDQAGWYEDWLESAPFSEVGGATLWLIGENLAQYNSTKPLLGVMGVTLVSANQGLAANPQVHYVSPFTFTSGCVAAPLPTFTLEGGCPVSRDYDGLGAAGTAVVTHRYSIGFPAQGPAAIIMNKDVALNWNTILCSFSWEDIRDFGSPGSAPAQTLARRVLNCVLPIWCQQDEDPMTDVDDEVPGPVPRQTVLHQNVPNPFNPVTAIRYDLARETNVRLAIYDPVGRLVRVLVRGVQPGGARSAVWDGTDENGRRVAGGLYYYRLEAGGFLATKRMVLIK